MESNVRDLGERLRKLQTEIEIIQRRRSQEAASIRKSLDSISAEDIEMLKPIVPELGTVVKFSQEALESNTNGERQSIHEVTAKLRSYLEQRLSYYEDQL